MDGDLDIGDIECVVFGFWHWFFPLEPGVENLRYDLLLYLLVSHEDLNRFIEKRNGIFGLMGFRITEMDGENNHNLHVSGPINQSQAIHVNQPSI